MDIKNFKSLESLQTASDVENMLRLLDRLPNLDLFIRINDEFACPIEPEEDGYLEGLLAENGSLTIVFNFVR